MITLVALASCALGAGVVGIYLGLASGSRSARQTVVRFDSMAKARIGLACALGIVVAALTRMPVAALAAGISGYAAPGLVGVTSGTKLAAKREALVEWVSALRDLLAGGTAMQQAIVASAEDAPDAIAQEVGALVVRVESGVTLPRALRALASEMADPAADRVVLALILACQYRGERLGALLDSLVRLASEEVDMFRRIETERARPRSAMRFVIAFTAAFAVLLFSVGHSYMAPYRSASGEAVLALIAVAYSAGVALMVKMARPPLEARLLAAAPDQIADAVAAMP